MKTTQHQKTVIGLVIFFFSLIILSGCGTYQPRGEMKLNKEGKLPFKFVVLGDSRAGERAYPENPASPSIYYLNIIDWINKSKPEFSVNIGDLILGYNTDEPGLAEKQWDVFDETVERYNNPLYMVVGNHDVWDKYSDEIYKKRYGSHYYAWRYEKCAFIAISADIPEEMDTIGKEQLDWLKRKLMESQKARHRFVFLHKPLWRYENKGTNFWMEQVHPLLKKYKVDTVFAGHWHHYELEEIDKIRYIVTGGGGAEIGRNYSLGDFFHFLTVSVNDNSRPVINVVREKYVYPETVVEPGLRKTVYGAIDQKSVTTDSKNNDIVSLPAINFMKNNIEIDFTLLSSDPKKDPSSNITLKLAPGETNSAEFSFSKDKRSLTFQVKVSRQEKFLAKKKFTINLPRNGTFSEPSGKVDKLKMEEVGQVVLGKENWTGTDDCSAAGWITKTKAGLIITIEVMDDKLVTMKNKDFWQNDSVELYFDVRPPDLRGKPFFEKGVLQIAIKPSFDKNVSSTLEFYPRANKIKIPGTTLKTKRTPKGYQVEVFLPFEGLKTSNFSFGREFNFSFGVNDADATARDTQMMWSGSDKNYCDPSSYGHLEFSSK